MAEYRDHKFNALTTEPLKQIDCCHVSYFLHSGKDSNGFKTSIFKAKTTNCLSKQSKHAHFILCINSQLNHIQTLANPKNT